MLFGFIGLIAGGMFGGGFAYFFNREKIKSLETDKMNLQIEKAKFEKDISNLESLLERNSEEFEKERRRITSQEKERYEAVIREKDARASENKDFYERQIVSLKVQHQEALQTQKADYTNLMNELKKTANDSFKSVAAEILKQESKDLQTQGTKTIHEILAPFRTEIDNFKGLIDQWKTSNTKNTASLEEKINSMSKTTQGMMQTAENLTKALKGNKKLQGNWGEMIIKDILDTAGLIEGRHYIPQAKEMKLEDSDTGKRQMPDFIINLPNGKHIILDSKVSLINYEQYCFEQDESLLKEFIKNIQSQIENLSSKKYHTNEKLNAPDFTIMCIPIEPAYLLAIKEDSSLYSKALEKHIVLCGPSNLFAILQIVGNLWITDNQNRNAKEIARRAKNIYDKLGTFIGYIDVMGSSIKKADDAYQKARGNLIDGKGSIARQLEDINSLATKHGLIIEGEIIENVQSTEEKQMQDFLV